MSKLPHGWKMVQVADVCDVNPRDPGPSKRSVSVSFIPMPAVSDREGVILEHNTKPFAEVAKGYTRFREGDVIFAKITPCMENGKIAIASGLRNGFACGSTEFHVLRSKGNILPQYLWRFLRHKSFRVDAERHMTGAVGQRRVPAQYIKDAAIPLPPVSEQRCIVAKIDSLLARSKKAREELDRIARLVERYKLAILAAAFRGDLAGGQGNDWPSRPLGEIADLQLGKMLDKAKNKGILHKYLRNVNVRWLAFDLSDLLQMPFTSNEHEKFSLRDGDILICEGGQPGRAAIWRGGETKIKYQKAIHRARPYPGYKPEWIVYQLFYAAHTGKLSDHFTGTTIKHLPQEALSEVPFLAPPEDVQIRMITAIDRAFLVIDKLAIESTRALKLLDRLDQATLAKAFRGDLLPRDASGFEAGTAHNPAGYIHPGANALIEADVETEAKIPGASTSKAVRTMTGNTRTPRSQAIAASRRSRVT
jgi:type I restriction enzyme S subunit